VGDGTKLAIAILVFWFALVFFFFAFHPGGVKDVSNPGQMLKHLVDEFGNLAGGTTETKAALTAETSSALDYPGYTSGSSNVGSVSPPVTTL
jgi:hypothetical protein